MNAVSQADDSAFVQGRRITIRHVMLWMVVLLLTVFPACALKRAQTETAAPKPEGAPVLAATVMQKAIPLQVKAIGSVEPYSTVAIKSQVSGELVNVQFTEGQFVKKGDVLFTIDPRPFEASLRQAEAGLAKTTAQSKQSEAALARSTAQARNAEAQARRYAELFQNGLVSRDQYDQFRTSAEALGKTVQSDQAAVETARQAIGADKAVVENARLMLSYTTIRSPMEGRTGSLMVNRGNLVKAGDTTPLVVINQVNPIYVSFTVPEKQLPEIRRYMQAGKLRVEAVPQGASGLVEEGAVTFVDNAVDTATGTIKLKATFANKQRQLWPGQFVSVTLTLGTQPDAIVVPTEAVQNGQQGPYVFVIRPDQTVEMRQVTIARTLGNDTIIEQGLKPGETVVTDGQLRLTPGAKVKIRGSAEAEAKAGS
ncbi:MAG: efflux RND transporter periplasmic adaptor subunit [Blastocatellia bacterium]